MYCITGQETSMLRQATSTEPLEPQRKPPPEYQHAHLCSGHTNQLQAASAGLARPLTSAIWTNLADPACSRAGMFTMNCSANPATTILNANRSRQQAAQSNLNHFKTLSTVSWSYLTLTAKTNCLLSDYNQKGIYKRFFRWASRTRSSNDQPGQTQPLMEPEEACLSSKSKGCLAILPSYDSKQL